MQPILNLNMPSEITTDVDFFYNFLALHLARQDLRGGALGSSFTLQITLVCLIFLIFYTIFHYFQSKKLQITSEKP